MEVRGKVWKFAVDDINTDQIHLSRYSHLPPEEIARHCLETLDPTFASNVQPGDIVIAGKNFGCGSARPAQEDFIVLGVGAIVAESLDRKFFHNAIGSGLLAFPCPGILNLAEAGHEIAVRPGEGIVENITTGAVLKVNPLPDFILEMIQCGGELGWLKHRLAQRR